MVGAPTCEATGWSETGWSEATWRQHVSPMSDAPTNEKVTQSVPMTLDALLSPCLEGLLLPGAALL